MRLVPPANLYVPALRAHVVAGQPVDVPDDLAGSAPDPGLEDAMVAHAAAVAARNHTEAARLRDVIIDLNPGSGLLAQGWLPAAADAAPTDESPAPKPARPPRTRTTKEK